MRVAVIRFPASNCDLDAVNALKAFPRLEPSLVWHEDRRLRDYDAVIVPGGFSYGDYLRAGAIAATSPAMRTVKEMAERGTPVLGICNGFQILVEAGMLPGALLRNTTLRFVCRWVEVEVENNKTIFTRGLRKGRVLRMPIAHNEGRFFLPRKELASLEADGLVAFRYCDDAGRATAGSNPTGTLHNIAGICNRAGNVVGLMPHPERSSERILSPFGSTDGGLLFTSLSRSAS
jgi:phosphoribosylformylglycinamidine synthase subunit PurQ / glutaminase